MRKIGYIKTIRILTEIISLIIILSSFVGCSTTAKDNKDNIVAQTDIIDITTEIDGVIKSNVLDARMIDSTTLLLYTEDIIGVASNDEGYSKLVLALYAVKDGSAMKVFTASNRNQYYYVKENLFANIASSGADDNTDTTLKYEKGEFADLKYATNESGFTKLEYSLLGSLTK